ncbi:hypothetical protein BT96DRAFT_846380 [Gymnopus androsaceus JB14]|uniref:F-box domain-containing protein n=1 Tax=Gymnopus androsaceus JB14 TaxID=1447944 RepID=A0A6A4IJP3_9AGAR|nr:hypothetical protein BT96DRAFT_846380 [Gymnopus androsaceus JB14]
MANHESEQFCPTCKQSNTTVPRVSESAVASMRQYLDSNKTVSPQQASEVAQLLKDTEKDIEDYSAEIARLETKIRSICNEVDFLQHYVEPWGRSILSPIRKLPLEVLHLIFVFCGLGGNTVNFPECASFMMRQPAWAVSSTCVKWRGVALSCKHLWSSIFVGSIWYAAQIGDYMVRVNHAVNRCFRQSHPHPLTLGFEVSRADTADIMLQNADRWQSVTIVLNATTIPSSTPELPVLEKLEIDLRIDKVIRGLQAFTRAPKLRELTLVSGQLQDPLEPFPWSQLTHLNLGYFTGPIFAALRVCESLMALSICASHDHGPVPPSGLPMDGSGVQLLKLQKLDISLAGNPSTASFHSLKLIFTSLTLPSLNELAIISDSMSPFAGSWTPDQFGAFIHRSQCNISSLRLDGMPFSEHEVLDIFTVLPSIQNLTIKDSKLEWNEGRRLHRTATTTLIKGLDVFRPFETRGTEVLLPNLERLEL